MRLSMWILADWLKKYQPVVKIEDGSQVLRGARVLSPDTRIEPQNVYLAPAGEYICGKRGKVLCVQGHDMMLLESSDMDSVLNDIFDAFDFYNSWADGLSRSIAEGCDLQYLVDESDRVFGEPLAVFDAGHLLIAHSSRYGLGDVDEEWDVMLNTGNNSLEILEKMRQYLHRTRTMHSVSELNFPFFSTRSLRRTLFHRQIACGQMILIEFHSSASKGTMQLFDTFGELMEEWMDHSSERKQLQEEYEIFRGLLEGRRVPEEELNRRLTVMGWEAGQEKLLLQIKIPEEYQEITFPLFSKLERLFADCCVFFHGEAIFLLANLSLTPWKKLQEDLLAVLSSSVFSCGVSYPFEEIRRLRTAAGQCALALQFASRKKGGIFLCSDHALEYLKDILRTFADAAAVHPALHTLKQIDRQTKSELYRTLYVYLSENANVSQTARLLHLHRNTLTYRLNKIQELTGVDLKDRKTQEHLYLSYVMDGMGEP